MKTKSTFLTILFSFLPGAGHMYLGLIKQGIQLMVLFFGTIFLSSLTVSFFGNVFSLLLFFLPFFFCYSIFDAVTKKNLINQQLVDPRQMAQENLGIFEWLHLPDKFTPKGKSWGKILAWILIVLGVLFLLNNGFNIVLDMILSSNNYSSEQINRIFNLIRSIRNLFWQILVAGALIFGGVYLLKATKPKAPKEEDIPYYEQDLHSDTKEEDK